MSSNRKVMKWSGKMAKRAYALDIDANVFKLENPYAIAVLLKISALKSMNGKETPFKSAMAILNFYINQAGKNLSSSQCVILEKAKAELRKLFHRDEI